MNYSNFARFILHFSRKSSNLIVYVNTYLYLLSNHYLSCIPIITIMIKHSTVI